ncbi:MAG: PorT family protein [Bacteroidetes bacterium HGW-Bacteroidetes-9]|jgi:hypothetical protein|nr:MAG: PorT family protein [Bacteroidetes bacterium HGW-Bacteroidetes-9]
MKKLILLTATFVICSLAYAQIPGFNIGPKVGATFSKFTTDQDQITEELKSTFHFGAFARIGKKVYLQPELVVMNRSGLLKTDLIDGSSNSIKITSIDLPVLLGVKVIDLKATNIRVMVGPVASLTLNKEISIENWENTINRDDFRNANWGIQFGAGADLLFLTLDLRYEIGMNDVSKLDGFDLKNNMFIISLGWKII